MDSSSKARATENRPRSKDSRNDANEEFHLVYCYLFLP